MKEFNFDNIPQELKDKKQWVVVKFEKRKDGTTNKIPYQINGSRAESDNPRTWTDFSTAENFVLTQKFPALGFVFNNDYTGIDLDECIKDGKITHVASRWIILFNSYTEYSHSKKGIHIILANALINPGRKKGHYEVYSSGRFFVFTGNIHSDYNKIISADEKFEQFYTEIFGEEKLEVKDAEAETLSSSPFSDSEILERARSAKNSDKFNALFDSDIKTYFKLSHADLSEDEKDKADESFSAADAALCSMLAFWTHKDAAQMDRLFRKSKLFRIREDDRDKWDKKHGARTYGEMTIGNAIANCKEVYVEPCDYTDLGNGKRFATLYRKDIRYCQPWNSWLIYKHTHWSIDDIMSIQRYAKNTVKEMFRDLIKLEGEERKKLAGHAFRSEAASRIEAMINLARSEEGIPILPIELDKNKMLFNCKNGTIDLTTGTLREHQKEDFITKLSPIIYDPKAECPDWLAFLRKFMNNNEDLIAYLQRVAGYCLTADVGEHKIFFLYGRGRNGKSTFLNTLLCIMGDYGIFSPSDIIFLKHGSHPTALADLKGKRFAMTIETKKGQRLSENVVKSSTGGDKITARKMRQDYSEFEATHKILVATNDKPIIKDTSEAMWSRIDLIPFNIRIKEEEKILNYHEKLLSKEASGILTWVVQGCLKWQNEGLKQPQEVIAATAAYKTEMDEMEEYLDDYCDVSFEYEDTGKNLYEGFLFWSKEQGEKYPMGPREFKNLLKERGFIGGRDTDVIIKGARGWRGLRLKPDCKYLQIKEAMEEKKRKEKEIKDDIFSQS